MVFVTGSVAPTGGVVVLQVSGIAGGPLTYQRSFGSGSYSTIYTVTNPTKSYDVFVDYGEGLQGPLPSNLGNYNYIVSDSVSSGVCSGLVPYQSLVVQPDFATVLFERSLEAGILGLSLPAGYQRPPVLHEMPKAGYQPIPYILVNQITLEQTKTQIGQDVPSTQSTPTGSAIQTLAILASRTWRVEIFCRTAGEREYYRDAVLAILQSMLAAVFQPLQLDTNHSFIVHSDQMVGKDLDPGFYFSDILFRTEGIYNVNLLPEYGVINNITEIISVTSSASGSALTATSGFAAQTTPPNFQAPNIASGVTLYSTPVIVTDAESVVVPVGDSWVVIE